MRADQDKLQITSPRKVAACLREILYQLSLRKPTLEEQFDMLRRYDDRVNIRSEGDPWNIVDRDDFSVSSLEKTRKKLEARLKMIDADLRNIT